MNTDENLRTINYDVIHPYSLDERNNMAMFLLPTLLGIVLSGALNYVKIPYSLVAMLTGGLFGVIGAYVPRFNQMANHFWNPSIITILFTPIVILKLIYFTDTYLLLKSLSQIILISTIGVLVFTCCFGFMVLLLTAHNITLANVAVAGMLFVPNDVPDIILELDGIKNLEILMDGESIFGTAFCLMTFELCTGSYDYVITEWYQFVMLILRFCILSIIVGLLIGMAIAFIFRQLYDDSCNATTTLIGVSYALYAICDQIFFCNPVIAIFIVIFYVAQERTRLGCEVDTDVINFLNICYFTIEVITTVALSNFIVLSAIEDLERFDVIISIGAYIIGNVTRLLSFLVISPILSRVGYGLNFTSMITIFWAAKKGPMITLQAVALSHFAGVLWVAEKLDCFIVVYLLMTIVVNGTTLKIILRTFGLIKFSITRKNNINNGFKWLLEKRSRLIVMMKMNRYFSDANWPLIHGITKLVNPYQSETGEEEADGISGWRRETYCPNCQKLIPVEPTRRDMLEMSKDISIRILKALRVSFARQYEHGLLNKDELRSLMQSVDIAMDSQDLILKLDDLFKIFRDRKMVDTVKKILVKFKMADMHSVPRQRLRKLCYKICTSVTFEILLFITIMSNIILMLLEIWFVRDISTIGFYVEFFFNVYFCLFYTIECIMKVLGMSCVNIKKGMKAYFSHYWNILDFTLLLIYWIYVLLFIYLLVAKRTDYRSLTQPFVIIMLVRVVRGIQVLKLVGKLAPQIIMYTENKIDVKVSFAFTLGTAMIAAYEEIIEQLCHIAYNDKIREQAKIRLDSDKLAVTQELGFIEKERPWITVTVKTKQAIRATLMNMKNAIFELKSSGFVDNFEFQILKDSLDDCFIALAQYQTIVPSSPKHIFYEIPWMHHEEAIIDFLYENVATKIWNAGDVISAHGKVIEGIFIVVAGVFKVTYVPSEFFINKLTNYGALPVKDVLNNSRFTEVQEEYILKGNSIGELSVLTGRPQCCSVISSTPSQAFIIPSQMISEAMLMSADPINGLACRMWKFCVYHLARRILQETPMYQALGFDYLNLVLDRAFVPNLSHFKILVLSDWVEDVVLIEGLIVDYVTRDIFSAPCYIPRTVQKMILPKSSQVVLKESVPTKMMIIPIKDIDGYDLMQRTQALSEVDSECAEVYMKYKKEQHNRRKNNWFNSKRSTMQSVGVNHMSKMKSEMQRSSTSKQESSYNKEEQP